MAPCRRSSISRDDAGGAERELLVFLECYVTCFIGLLFPSWSEAHVILPRSFVQSLETEKHSSSGHLLHDGFDPTLAYEEI